MTDPVGGMLEGRLAGTMLGAASLAGRRGGRTEPVPHDSPTAAPARNLALYPVIRGHGFRRLVPF
jgi:hypothetical protein